jgi:hypothetical protein
MGPSIASIERHACGVAGVSRAQSVDRKKPIHEYLAQRREQGPGYFASASGGERQA